MLTEVAPGFDLEAEVLGRIDAKVTVADELTEMDPRIFRPEPMGEGG